MAHYYLLVVTALGASERAHFAGTVRWHDRRLVPVEDVAAGFAALPEGNHRAPLADDLAARHLYRHPASGVLCTCSAIVRSFAPESRSRAGFRRRGNRRLPRSGSCPGGSRFLLRDPWASTRPGIPPTGA